MREQLGEGLCQEDLRFLWALMKRTDAYQRVSYYKWITANLLELGLIGTEEVKHG